MLLFARGCYNCFSRSKRKVTRLNCFGTIVRIGGICISICMRLQSLFLKISGLSSRSQVKNCCSC